MPKVYYTSHNLCSAQKKMTNLIENKYLSAYLLLQKMESTSDLLFAVLSDLLSAMERIHQYSRIEILIELSKISVVDKLVKIVLLGSTIHRRTHNRISTEE